MDNARAGPMQLHYRTYGRGWPLIVLHGLCGSLDNWHPISQRLAAHVQVFAVDLRNHGLSPVSPKMDYPVMAGDLAEFCREHAIARAHVLGHSMGGKTAMSFALAFPERVRSLLIVDVAPRAGQAAHEDVFRALLAVDLKSCATRLQIEHRLASAIPDAGMRRFLLKNLTRDSRGAYAWRSGLRHIFHNYASLTAAVPATGVCDRPALFIRGDRSDYIRDADAPDIRRRFPRAEIRTIRDAGHWVHADAPGAFLEVVEAFLRQPATG
jgi:esterase